MYRHRQTTVGCDRLTQVQPSTAASYHEEILHVTYLGVTGPKIHRHRRRGVSSFLYKLIAAHDDHTIRAHAMRWLLILKSC